MKKREKPPPAPAPSPVEKPSALRKWLMIGGGTVAAIFVLMVWSIGSEFSNEGGEVDPETMRKAAEATRRMIEIAQEASSPVEAPPRRAASMHRPPLPRRCVRPIRPRPLCRRDRRCGMSPEPGARTRRGLHVPAKWSADRVAPRADGSAQIEFKTRGNISEDPALINRITDSYNAKMDR